MSHAAAFTSAERTARVFRRAVLDCEHLREPYPRWRMVDALPDDIAVGVISLPIAPLRIADSGGVRDRDNSKRTFLTPALQADFPVCAVLAEAMQRRETASLLAQTCGFEADGAFLRIEYIQDLDGAWLEPHRDIPEKLCSVVIYLCSGPYSKDWGTDIYDHDRRWVGRASGAFNSASIFVPGPHTWHGFDPRPIQGVRRLIEVNYVRPTWRDRDQLCFPERPISLAEV